MTDKKSQAELDYLNTLLNPHIFLVPQQKAELAETICAALTSYGWMPIETAPRDVPVILFFLGEGSKHEGNMPICYWDAYYAEGGSGYTGGDGWTVAFAGEQAHLHFSGSPTHWMPLPLPPSAKEGG